MGMRREVLCLSVNLVDRFLAANQAQELLKKCSQQQSNGMT